MRSWMLFAHKVPALLPVSPPPDAQNANTDHPQELEAIREQQDAMQAEIKQHDQTKVETFSKYPLRLSGLILFNAFSNAGVVDNTELPTIALARFPGASHGSSGATLKQTLLTLDATGPRIAGARSSANVSIDFFGGVSSNTYGYSSSAGVCACGKAGSISIGTRPRRKPATPCHSSLPYRPPLTPPSRNLAWQAPAIFGPGHRSFKSSSVFRSTSNAGLASRVALSIRRLLAIRPLSSTVRLRHRAIRATKAESLTVPTELAKVYHGRLPWA